MCLESFKGNISVTYTDEIPDEGSAQDDMERFRQLRGIAKELFEDLGGGEAFIREERSKFSSQ